MWAARYTVPSPLVAAQEPPPVTCVMAAPQSPYFSLVHDALRVLSTDEWDPGTPGGLEGPRQLSQVHECCRAASLLAMQRQHSSFPPASLVTPTPPAAGTVADATFCRAA